MPLFEQKPPRVEAVQWDGTESCFNELRELLKSSRHCVVGWELTSYYDVDTINSRTRLGLKYGDEQIQMHPSDWLVLTKDGDLELIGDERFKRNYVSVED